MRIPSFSRHKVALGVLDAVLISASFAFAFWVVFASGWYDQARGYPIYFVPSVLLLVGIFLAVFQIEGLYKYQAITNTVHQLQSLMRCFLRVIAAFILIVFFLKTEYFATSRFLIGLGFLISFVCVIIARTLVVPRIYYFLVKKRIVVKRALIVGAGEHGTLVCEHLENSSKSYFDIVGFCDDDVEKVGTAVCGKPVLGTSYELETIIARHRAKEIIIAISHIDRATLLDLIDRCKTVDLAVHVISELFSRVGDRLQAEEFGGIRTLRLDPRNNGIIRTAAKRLLDLLGSSLLLLFSSPLFLFIAWAIKRDSEGTVLYESEVVGKDGKRFTAFKFRSMICDNGGNPDMQRKYEEGKQRHAEFMKAFIQGKTGSECFVEDEHRITRVGRILRKYSLDELPQLINILRGEMSLVGPRFCSPTEYDFYKPWHQRRFQVKPGITGLWQVRARSEVTYDDMVTMDLYYIENWSLLFDFEILLRTIPVVLTGKGSRVQ